jgi:hypothetical protein
MDDHSRNDDKDGRETNPAISAIIERLPEEDAVLEEEYREFCRVIGIQVREYHTATRKYWPIP